MDKIIKIGALPVPPHLEFRPTNRRIKLTTEAKPIEWMLRRAIERVRRLNLPPPDSH